MKSIRVGIIGAGGVVENRHLPALSGVDGVECAILWSRSGERAHRVADKFSIPKVAERWEEVCESPEVDAVVIATPPILHCAATLYALDRRKHVLCQGRMARNLTEALRMRDAAAACGLVAGLYPPRPGLKGDRVMKRLLADGYAGDLSGLLVTALSGTERAVGRSWKSDPDVIGVNAMTLGMWAEVVHRWIGPAQNVSAVARFDGLDPGAPNSIAVAAEMKCGAASWFLSESAGCNSRYSIEIQGSRGALVYRLFAEEILGAQVPGEPLKPIPIDPTEERAHSTDVEFIDAIRNHSPLSPTFDDGVQYMEFCEAVAFSAMTNSGVRIPMEAPSMESWGRRLPRPD